MGTYNFGQDLGRISMRCRGNLTFVNTSRLSESIYGASSVFHSRWDCSFIWFFWPCPRFTRPQQLLSSSQSPCVKSSPYKMKTTGLTQGPSISIRRSKFSNHAHSHVVSLTVFPLVCSRNLGSYSRLKIQKSILMCKVLPYPNGLPTCSNPPSQSPRSQGNPWIHRFGGSDAYSGSSALHRFAIPI